jgi:hypothetical protein
MQSPDGPLLMQRDEAPEHARLTTEKILKALIADIA